MGLLSAIFDGLSGKQSAKQSATSVSFLQTYSGGSGGWGLDRFQSIIDAHSSLEDMVEEWGLNSEGCPYMSVDGYANPYTQAYQEEYEKASMEAMVLEMLGMEVDVEDLMDMDEVEENAYEYALDLADAWYSGAEWIPIEVMNWAWYQLSDHNI